MPPTKTTSDGELIFLKHVRQIVKSNGRRDTVKAERKEIRDTAKAAGLDLGKLDLVLKIASWPPGERIEFFDTLLRYAGWLGMPVALATNQLDLFAADRSEEDRAEHWRSMGYLAAMTGAGAFAVVPEDVPVEHHQDWLKGQAQAQETLASAMAMPDPDPTDPEGNGYDLDDDASTDEDEDAEGGTADWDDTEGDGEEDFAGASKTRVH